MKNLSIGLIALFILAISSCGTGKDISEKDAKNPNLEMQGKGFTEGEVVHFDIEGECAYAIKTSGANSELLDPLNLAEEFKVDGKKIWFTFASLRMANRCEKARPIEIGEITSREE